MSASVVAMLTIGGGILLSALGLASWRSGGKGAVIGGAIFVVLGIYLRLTQAGSGAKYPVLALLASLVIVGLVKTRLAVGREWRLELLLVAAAIVAIYAASFVADSSASMRVPLVAFGAVCAASFVIAVLVRTTRLILTARRNVRQSPQ